MGYPSQPQGPYGQQPQQPYGQSGPQPPYGYGQPPPMSPPPPPQRNVGVILLLAIGLPLLLLGSCTAVVVALGGTSTVTTEPDSPILVAPSRVPATSAPAATEDTAAAQQQQEQPAPVQQEQVQQEQSTAAVGGSITLQGMDAGLKMKVTVDQFFNPATPAEDYMKPKTGTKLVALQVTLSNVGQAVYNSSPEGGAVLIDDQGQQYRTSFGRITEGQGLGGQATINTGDTRKGVIIFEAPESAKLVKFQYGLNSGFAKQKGEWTLS